MDVYKFIPGKEFENKIDKNSIMILGEFEFFHKGHNSLLEKAKEAKNENDQIGIFIIEKNKNPILTLDNKLQTLAQIGFDFAIVAEFTTDFMNMSGHDFLQQLERNINISRYIFGSDFAFGKNRQINKENFKDVTDKNFTVVELLKIKNKKISSSDIKEMFLFGEINLINTILVHPLIFDVEFVDQKLKWINKNNLHPGIYYVDILIDEYWYSGIIHISMENNVDFHLINYEFENNVVINQKTKLVLLDIKRVIINQRYDKIERDKLESVINFFEGKNTSSKN